MGKGQFYIDDETGRGHFAEIDSEVSAAASNNLLSISGDPSTAAAEIISKRGENWACNLIEELSLQL